VKQRSVEIVLDRLLIDEKFRRRFLRDSREALWDLFEPGMHLTQGEIAAVATMETELGQRAAKKIDP
jgi:hypothetical protein